MVLCGRESRFMGLPKGVENVTEDTNHLGTHEGIHGRDRTDKEVVI